jgi:thioredoxin-related protein
MRSHLLIFLCLFSLGTFGQNVGVHFEEIPGWKQVLEKAAAENKFIFVDVMATWCAPCKAMDKFTYPQQKLAEVLNPQFISVKVQMDSTATDNPLVKSWYADAAVLRSKYNITALPTLLFFDPKGRVIHRASGMKDVTQMIDLAKDALDPTKQLYTLLDKYRSGGTQDLSKLPQLVETARGAGDEMLARSIAQEYLEKRILTMAPGTWRPADIEFARENLHSSAEKAFRTFIDPVTSKAINDTMSRAGFPQNYSSIVTDRIIMEEEVDPKLSSGKVPDWKKLREAISKKYGTAAAGRVILNAQLKVSWEKKEWDNVTRLWFKKLNTYGMDDTSYFGRGRVNNFIYTTVLTKVNDKALLKEALRWMARIVRADELDTVTANNYGYRTNAIDTYAKLLYKYGKKDQAISWQQKAADLNRESAAKNKQDPDKGFLKSLEEMKKNTFNWTDQK